MWSVQSLVSTCDGHTRFVMAVARCRPCAHPQRLDGLHGPRVAPRRHLKNTFTELHTHGEGLVALPDNQHALSASNDNTVKLFNVNDGAVLRTFRTTGAVVCLALLPDGLRFVSGSCDGTACIAYRPRAAVSKISKFSAPTSLHARCCSPPPALQPRPRRRCRARRRSRGARPQTAAEAPPQTDGTAVPSPREQIASASAQGRPLLARPLSAHSVCQ